MSQSRVPPRLPEVTVERKRLTVDNCFEKSHCIIHILKFFFVFTISASETGPILRTIMSTSTKVGGPVDQKYHFLLGLFSYGNVQLSKD
jgi:hypothetical protein